MKSFIIALSAIILLIILTIINAVAIDNATLSLKEAVNSLTSITDFGTLEALWQKHKFLICISSSGKETEKIDFSLSVLKAKLINNIDNGLEEEKALLIDYIDKIASDEKVTLGGII